MWLDSVRECYIRNERQVMVVQLSTNRRILPAPNTGASSEPCRDWFELCVRSPVFPSVLCV